MKTHLFFQKAMTGIVFLLLFAVTIGTPPAVNAELIPESSIIKLAVPSAGQTFYGAAETYHDVAVAKDGSFVVVWVLMTGNAFSANEYERSYTLPVYARRFNPDGTPRTEIIEVCDPVPDEDKTWNTSPGVACDDAGNFAVCWAKVTMDAHAPDIYQIYARVFDADGNPRSSEMQISDDDSKATREQTAIDMNRNGEFVIAWNKDRTAQSEIASPVIYSKRFDKDGLAMDARPIEVKSTGQINSRPSVAINTDGGFAVSWSTRHLLYSYVMTIGQGVIVTHMVRRFNQYGLPQGPTRKVDVIRHFDHIPPKERTDSDGAPVIAMNDDGEYAVSHYRYRYIHNFSLIRFHDAGYRFYNKTGLARSLDQDLDISMRKDSLVNAMDNAGNLIMGWMGCNADNGCENSEAIYLMQVSKSSPASGNSVRVIENVPPDPFGNAPDISYPRLDASPDGRVVVVWHNNENLLGRIYTIR